MLVLMLIYVIKVGLRKKHKNRTAYSLTKCAGIVAVNSLHWKLIKYDVCNGETAGVIYIAFPSSAIVAVKSFCGIWHRKYDDYST